MTVPTRQIPRPRKAGAGAVVSLLLLGGCLLALSRLGDSAIVPERLPGGDTCARFFVAVAVVYALSYALWRAFARHFGMERSRVDALIDMGLLAVGKYVPGKVWGILARGAGGSEGPVLSAGRASVSLYEQLVSLACGTLLVGALALSQRIAPSVAGAIAALLAATLVAAALLWQAFGRNGGGRAFHGDGMHRRFRRLPAKPVGFARCSALAFGYCLLWIASAAPLVVLVHDSIDPDSALTIALATAFLGAMIAGWLAVFAPGGIGVREAAFVTLAPDALSWQEGLYWITLHRGLSLAFDLAFGIACLVAMSRRARRAASA